MNSFPVIKIIPEEGKASVTIVCYGGIVDEVLKAIEVLFVEDEILVEVFVVSEISNSEITGLADSISRSKKLCFIEEGNSFASYSSEVVTTLIEKGCKIFSLQRISNNSIIPSSRELEIHVLPTSNKIKNIINKFVNE
jgi:2-oxoisovalerate dehydrogenase E1 component